MSDKPKIKLQLEKPMFPNFIKLTGGGELTISIGALDDEDLALYAEYWKQGLIEHAKSKRDAYTVQPKNKSNTI